MTAKSELALIEKYCPRELPADFNLYEQVPLKMLLVNKVYALEVTEQELRRVAHDVAATAKKVLTNLDAGPDDLVYQLNSLGELQSSGPKMDRLIALREEHIRTIQALVHHIVKGAQS